MDGTRSYYRCRKYSSNSKKSVITPFVVKGHDCCPMLFKYDLSKAELQYVDKVDKSLKKEVDGFRYSYIQLFGQKTHLLFVKCDEKV